jgi:hypothetical protein
MNTMKTFFKISAVIALALIAFSGIVHAQGTPIDPTSLGTSPITSVSEATGRFNTYVSWFYGLFWALAVVFLIWAAVTYLTANGDSDKVETSKQRVVYAVIAACIALLATGIKSIAGSLLSAS